MAKAIKVEGTFKHFSIASSGVATIKFRAPFSEVARYLNLVGLQDQDLKLMVKENVTGQTQKVGVVRLKQINFKGEEGAEFIFKGESLAIPTFDSFLDKTVTFAVKPANEDDGD